MLDCRRGYGKHMGWDDQWEHGDRNGDWQMALVDCHVEPCFSKGCLMLGLFVSYLLRSQVHDQSGKGRHLRQNPCQVTETRNAPESLSTHENMQYVILCYMFIYVCDILWKVWCFVEIWFLDVLTLLISESGLWFRVPSPHSQHTAAQSCSLESLHFIITCCLQCADSAEQIHVRKSQTNSSEISQLN